MVLLVWSELKWLELGLVFMSFCDCFRVFLHKDCRGLQLAWAVYVIYKTIGKSYKQLIS